MVNKNIIVAVFIHAAITVVSSGPRFNGIDNISPSSETTCNPETDCSAQGLGAKVPDPEDCHNFFFCVTSDGQIIPSDAPIPCPTNQFFDVQTSSCQIETVPCVNVCDKCLINCDIVGVQIADPFDCTMFFVCLQTGPPPEDTHLSCPTDEIFDDAVGRCVAGENCTSVCTPTPTTTLSTTTSSTTTSSTTTSSTTTSSTTTALNDGCPNSFTCPANGNFPRCSFCDPSYFYCSGGTAEIMFCPSNTVFNTNPCYPFCVLPENCPLFS